MFQKFLHPLALNLLHKAPGLTIEKYSSYFFASFHDHSYLFMLPRKTSVKNSEYRIFIDFLKVTALL
jgi:hypothetical protein